ncbi:LrgB family protein [Neisseria leonii]|uniref:LrgB family protein n=1 Tax=Neisseria leonii TaxID=2995413 RepID=A0A9X4E673_9NEIS|nr:MULTISPECIES: LrgB family protein [unclassified Neisseria]MDD9326279.1 LrgB family protein [Neisseria sp. 3986]MDD9328591.1 LrgB family protein [Neisseria sp. 51.81]
MLNHSFTLLWLTLFVYWVVNILRARTGSVLVNPVAWSTFAVIVYLRLFDIDYATYHGAAQYIDFWLKPAVVGLAVPLYLSWGKIRRQWLPIILSQTAGSLTGMVSVVWLAKMSGSGREVMLSLAAKSVTTPIALEVTKAIGGIPPITAATVILAGLVGQVAGYQIMRRSRVRRPMSQGMSMGSASHAMGIAASLERSKKFAAYASLGLILNGIITAALAPFVVPLLVD